MNEETKRKMTRNYFKAFPKWAIVFIIIGAITLLIGLSGSGKAAVFGLVVAGLGALGIYLYTQGKPTDQQMDQWLEEDLLKLSEKALLKTGTDKDETKADPVTVTGPRFWDVGGASILWKRGKDKILRYSPMEVSVINFTEHQLLSYKCVLDRTTGNPLNEGTEEFFYKDVVSVSTTTESETKDEAKDMGVLGKIQMNAAEYFMLLNAGGGKLRVFLRDPKLIAEMGGGEIPTTRAEKAIAAIRTMLRAKKSTLA